MTVTIHFINCFRCHIYSLLLDSMFAKHIQATSLSHVESVDHEIVTIGACARCVYFEMGILILNVY